MRILVTGAAGFVGAPLVRGLLTRGHEVLALVRPGSDPWRLHEVLPRVERLEADLADPSLAARIAAARPEAAVHLAWYTAPGQYLDALDNLASLEASLHLVRSLANASCRRFVGVGTCLEYAPGPGPFSESSPTGPTRLYAAAKLALATVLERLRATTGMSTVWARLFSLYGPGEDQHRLIPTVLRGLLAGGVARVSSGEQVRDYLHVEDAAGALATITVANDEGVFNVASGHATTIRALVLTAARTAGRPGRVELGAIDRDPRDPDHIVADVRRLQDLGFHPRFDLNEGLEHTLRWWAPRLRTDSRDPAR